MTTSALAAVAERSPVSTDDVRRARERADLNQSVVAARLRISLRSYRRWEREGRPLPRSRTILDVFEAIDALRAERDGT